MDNRPTLEPTTLSSLVAIGLAKVESAQSIKRLDGWEPFTIDLYLAKFGCHWPQGSGDISFFIYHVTSSGQVIAESRNFAGCSPSA